MYYSHTHFLLERGNHMRKEVFSSPSLPPSHYPMCGNVRSVSICSKEWKRWKKVHTFRYVNKTFPRNLIWKLQSLMWYIDKTILSDFRVKALSFTKNKDFFIFFLHDAKVKPLKKVKIIMKGIDGGRWDTINSIYILSFQSFSFSSVTHFTLNYKIKDIKPWEFLALIFIWSRNVTNFLK